MKSGSIVKWVNSNLHRDEQSTIVVLSNSTWFVGNNQVKMCYVLLNGTIRYVFERQIRGL
jgi:hypothetical protein